MATVRTLEPLLPAQPQLRGDAAADPAVAAPSEEARVVEQRRRGGGVSLDDGLAWRSWTGTSSRTTE